MLNSNTFKCKAEEMKSILKWVSIFFVLLTRQMLWWTTEPKTLTSKKTQQQQLEGRGSFHHSSWPTHQLIYQPNRSKCYECWEDLHSVKALDKLNILTIEFKKNVSVVEKWYSGCSWNSLNARWIYNRKADVVLGWWLFFPSTRWQPNPAYIYWI